MAEMIIPGTYIAVQSEGLISAGRIATGILGIVGTAASGPVGVPVTLAGFANAREVFGVPDSLQQPEDGSHPLTLVRSLEQLYNNGASSVVAVRVAGSSQTSAIYAVRDDSGNSVAVLTAETPGTWGNSIRVQIAAAAEDCRIDSENHTTGFTRLNYAPVVPTAETRIRVFRGISKSVATLEVVYKRVVTNEEVKPNAGAYRLSSVPIEAVPTVTLIRILDRNGQVVRSYQNDAILYGTGAAPGDNQVRINTTTGELTFATTQAPGTNQVIATYAVGHTAPTAGQVVVSTWDGGLTFAAGEAPTADNGDRLIASYRVEQSACVQVSLSYGVTTERYTVPDGKTLAQAINASSRLVTAIADTTHGGKVPRTTPPLDAYFGTGSNQPGNNGAAAGTDEYAAGLESLANQLINIVVLAGQNAKDMGAVLLGHLKATEATDFERIGVIGAAGSEVADLLGHDQADERVILVAPGITYPDGTTLPAAYTAAAVAGLISSIPVQTSLTNKAVNVPGLSVAFNRGQQEQLIQRNVLTIAQKQGYRIVKGITTAGEGTPFSAIPTRRIVDYAKYGVRSAANPYLGRLNNSRVRAAMKGTLDAFLTRMVEDEALTGYELEVTATRSQEIAGEVSIIMTIQPTFSIEYIRVTMILK